jgi:RimJ/RimL family protein N-acetyltransferase
MPDCEASMLARKIHLRDVRAGDLPVLFQHQLDPDANRMAAVNPRDEVGFQAHWMKILSDRAIIAKAILIEDQVVGCISCFPRDGKNLIGYWIAKEHWGGGVATRGLALLLDQIQIRPLHAYVARNNVASIRVLEHCGFTIEGYRKSPATDRFLECEEAILMLGRERPRLENLV